MLRDCVSAGAGNLQIFGTSPIAPADFEAFSTVVIRYDPNSNFPPKLKWLFLKY